MPILTIFEKTNRSLADIIVWKTLIGNDTDKFIVKSSIKTRAILYSPDVSPLSKTSLRLKVKNRPMASAVTPTIVKMVINKPFSRYMESVSFFALYFAKYLKYPLPKPKLKIESIEIVEAAVL